MRPRVGRRALAEVRVGVEYPSDFQERMRTLSAVK